MIARIHKSMREKDQGFTLIELLVVMIIIGILAAIAIPVFLNQRAKARDTAAKADVSTFGKEIAAYYVDNLGAPPAATVAGGRLTLGGEDIGPASDNIIATGTGSTGTSDTAWCVSVGYTGGTENTIAYGAQSGLGAPGSTCSAAGAVVAPTP